MLQIVGVIILAYIIVQSAYSGYFFSKSGELAKKTYVGKKTLGNPKNPEFHLFLDGDSVGAGVGASSFETSVGGRISGFYAQKYYVHFVNQSISGSAMNSLVDRLLPDEKQNLTVLIISSNDLFHFSSVSNFKPDTRKVLERYSKNTDKLIIIGPGRIFDSTAIPIVIRPIYQFAAWNYSKIIASEAKNFSKVVYVNPLITKINRSNYGYESASDGFHPNDEGHRFWFDLIRPVL